MENEKRRLCTKADGDMSSSTLQNPSVPEATFRSRAGKEQRGYAGNLEESVEEKSSVVTNYQYEQNNHRNSQFIQKHLAAEKNVELILTSLTGKAAPDIFANFEFNEEGTKVLRCPAGYATKSSFYMKQSGQCAALFQDE